MGPGLRRDDKQGVIVDPRLRRDDKREVIVDPRLRGDDVARRCGAAPRQRHFKNLVSASFDMSGSDRMIPASIRTSAASLLNCACSPVKNFWLASRSCQR